MIPVDVSRGLYLVALANVKGSGVFAEAGELLLACPCLELAQAWATERHLVIGVLGFGALVRAGRPRAERYGPPFVVIGSIEARA